jgi:hypothetical protein
VSRFLAILHFWARTGRPKGRKNNALLLKEALFKPIRVKDGQTVHTLPKLVAAAEVCLNNALKGDLRSFMKIMELADKYGLLERAPPENEITEIRRIIVDPRNPTGAQESGERSLN